MRQGILSATLKCHIQPIKSLKSIKKDLSQLSTYDPVKPSKT